MEAYRVEWNKNLIVKWDFILSTLLAQIMRLHH